MWFPEFPKSAQVCDTTIFWAASSLQQGVAPKGDDRYTRTPRPVFHPQLRFLKDIQQDMKARSVNVSSPNLALHTVQHTSTYAPMPCGTGQYSFQRSSYPRKHQSAPCSNDLRVMHSSSGTMLLEGLSRLTKARAYFPHTVPTAPPLP